MPTHLNINYIKPLLLVTKYLAISPDYNFVKRKLTQSRCHKLYSFFFACALNVLVIYSSLGKSRSVFKFMSKTRIFLELTSMSFLYLTNFLSTGNLIFLKSRQFEAILIKLAVSDDIISKYKKLDGKKINTIWFEIICIFVFAFTTVSFSSYLWTTTTGFDGFKNYLCEHLERMRLLFVVWLSYKIVLAVRYRFLILNHVLSETLSEYLRRGNDKACQSILGNNFKSINHSNKWMQDVRTMGRLYSLLSEIVELFNDVFGWVLLFMFLNNICGFLVSAHHVITFQTRYVPTSVIIFFVAFTCTYVAPFLTLGAILASYCNGCVKASRETSMLAYKLLHELKDTYSEESQRLCEDLHLLAQQATTRYPTFSAAGFCKIDYTLLFTMIGIFTSYLVVVIQFIKMYENFPMQLPYLNKH